jgi:hypothetical protein
MCIPPGKILGTPLWMGDLGIWDLDYGIWYLVSGVWYLVSCVLCLGSGIWDLGSGIWDLDLDLGVTVFRSFRKFLSLWNVKSTIHPH